MEKDLILEKNDDIADTFNDIFTSVVSKLNIPRYQDRFIDSNQIESRVGHPILRIIEKYKSHTSVIAIKVGSQLEIRRGKNENYAQNNEALSKRQREICRDKER